MVGIAPITEKLHLYSETHPRKSLAENYLMLQDNTK